MSAADGKGNPAEVGLPGVIGHVHSIQSFGAADGPGVRCVVFLQGCPLRCVYCHNPDTWEVAGGEAMSAEEVMKRVMRMRHFFGKEGGLTVSGGEPLVQRDFVYELFRLARENGVHTALDTSGVIPAQSVLDVCDMVLLDVKFTTEADYHTHARGSLKTTMAFLDTLEARGIRTWVRHVLVPGMTDDEAGLHRLADLIRPYRCVEKIELLPFRTLCIEKYEKLDIPFPLRYTRQATQEDIENAYRILNQHEV